MTHADKYREIAARYFDALTRQDIDAWVTCHAPNAIYNVNGATPVSGRTAFPDLLEKILPKIFSKLDPEAAQIGVNWKIMCADDKRCVVFFEGRCKTADGRPYNNRYCQTWEMNETGQICEVWEFFDTALANECLFGADTQDPDYPAFTY